MTKPPNGKAAAASRPTIPNSELRKRPARLGRALADAGFEAWIAYGDDRAVAGADHIRFLANLEPHFEPIFVVGRADQSQVVLLTGPETIGYAALVTQGTAIDEIIAIDELVHPEEEYPTISISSGADRLRSLFSGTKRIAVLGMDAIPTTAGRRLLDPLREGGWVTSSGDSVAYALRAVKTDAEQAVIDEAYRIARAGLEAVATSLRPGITERDVAATAEAAMRHAGAEGFGIDTMVASGVANTAPILARSTFRTIGPDDTVTVTLAPRYEGYHAALARAFLFRPNLEVQRAIEVAVRGQRAALEYFKVGVEGRRSALAVREVLESGSTGAELPYVPVHSVGLIEFEPPIFLSSSNTPIQNGMALSVDAALFHGPWGGLRIEDGFSIQSGEVKPRFADYEAIVPTMLA